MPDIKVFSGRASEALTKEICQHIEMIDPAWKSARTEPIMGQIERKNFSDGEQYDRPLENIRGRDVFIVQSTRQPDANLVNLMFMTSTMKFASAARVTAVIPYYGYGRQDRKDRSRGPVPVSDIPKMFGALGLHRVILLDVHSTPTATGFQTAGVIPDHLYARPVFLKHLRSKMAEVWDPARLLIAAPDANADGLAEAYCQRLGAHDVILVTARRNPDTGKKEIIKVIGDPKGFDVLIVDDMIDSGKTTCHAAEELKRRGAGRIYALATHAVFSDNAIERFQCSVIENVWVTDSIHHPDICGPQSSKIEVVSIASLLAKAILRTHRNASVSELFEEE